MKNVIYINCYAEPWIKVAEKLQSEHGYKPVYWVGYNEDDSVNLVPQHFPDIVYQKYYDAWKGVFPSNIAEKAKECYLDVDFLRKFASEELQAIKMMDRLDIDQRSFNFMERQRHFRNLLRSWMAVIELYKPDFVVTPMIPHRVYDYAFYLLCKYRGIPYISFNHTQFIGRYIVLDDIFSIEELFVHDYKLFENKEEDDIILPLDISSRLDKVKKDYLTALPYGNAIQSEKHKKSSSFYGLFEKFLEGIKENHQSFWGKNGVLHQGIPCYYKLRRESMENSHYSIFRYSLMKLRTNKIKRGMASFYNSLATKPDYNQNYVVCFLHYQPEATTSPRGDIYVDQSLWVDTLLKHLPRNYMVYVKEHPHQFLAHREGQTNRIKEFYLDLAQKDRVKLIDLSIDSFALMENAKAVSTITGTVGWEAMVRHKPVLLFGLAWYENYKGVLRIKDDNSARGMISFIEKYQYDEHSLKAYLASVGKNTKCAYYYKGKYKDDLQMSEETCVENITSSIIEKIKQKYEDNKD